MAAVLIKSRALGLSTFNYMYFLKASIMRLDEMIKDGQLFKHDWRY